MEEKREARNGTKQGVLSWRKGSTRKRLGENRSPQHKWTILVKINLKNDDNYLLWPIIFEFEQERKTK